MKEFERYAFRIPAAKFLSSSLVFSDENLIAFSIDPPEAAAIKSFSASGISPSSFLIESKGRGENLITDERESIVLRILDSEEVVIIIRVFSEGSSIVFRRAFIPAVFAQSISFISTARFPPNGFSLKELRRALTLPSSFLSLSPIGIEPFSSGSRIRKSGCEKEKT